MSADPEQQAVRQTQETVPIPGLQKKKKPRTRSKAATSKSTAPEKNDKSGLSTNGTFSEDTRNKDAGTAGSQRKTERTTSRRQKITDESSANPGTRKPLNFAPPAIKSKPPKHASAQTERHSDSLGGLEDPSHTARSRAKPRREKSAVKGSVVGAADVSRQAPEGVFGHSYEDLAPVAPEPSRPSKFAAQSDPFPAMNTDNQSTSTSFQNSISSQVRTADNSRATQDLLPRRSSNARGKAQSQTGTSTDDRQSTGRPSGGRRRVQKEQLPASMFLGQTVTRGPHGRMQFAAIPQSASEAMEGLHLQVSRPDHSQSVQRDQYTSGPGLVAQNQRNHEADKALLAYQRSLPLNFAPPSMNSVSTQAGVAQPTDVSAHPAVQEKRHAREKPAYFDEHITKEEAVAGLEDGRYYKGQLRITQKARKDAWVTLPKNQFPDGDIWIEGERSRNRALNGDEVVLEIIDPTAGAPIANEPDRIVSRTRGRVVFIWSQRPVQRISGFIRPPGWNVALKRQDERSIIQNVMGKNTCTFHPQDQRIPWLTISQYDLPRELQGKNWIFNVLQKQKTIYAARIVTWQSHARTPRGIVVEELGLVGNIDTETAAILADCDVDVRDHPASAMMCLPETPWRISDEELSKRRDFRKDRVCTIDPETARDLDDALSVRRLPDGNYEIGVHIADVSHFIQQDNALDKIARERATTVYMVQKAIPMLPRLLCEELCSLNPAVDRLAFSVTWTLNEDGEEVGPRWYGRSVIRSAVRFAYGEAQNLLDGKSWAEGVGKPVDGGHTEEEITSDVKVLLKMSKAMRARRFENGALTINAFKLNFRLQDDGMPGVAEVYQLKDANRLIEEFMLKANISVAEKIVDAFPEHALLRMHPPPKDRPLEEFVSYAQKLGIPIDTSSSATMQAAFTRLAELAKSNPVVGVLQNSAVKSMCRASYMCTGLHEDREEWAHYALAVPLYTHFTSPIRRYADVIVHRLLDRALKTQSAGFQADDCEAWATNCNFRKENARLAQDRSSMLYLCAYIEASCRKNDAMGTDAGMEVTAIVIAVRDRSIDIIIPDMALEKRIYYDDSYAIENFVHNEPNETTTIFWRTEEQRLAAIKAADDEVDREALESTTSAGARGTVKKSNKDKNIKALAPSKGNPVKEASKGTVGQPVAGDVHSSLQKSDGMASDGALLASGDGRKSGAVTTIAVLDKIKVWLRGDFEVSPCQVNAGFVLPHEN